MNLQISKEKRRGKFGFFFISRQISVQKFRSILVGKPCGLLTRRRNRKYRLLRSRGRVLSVLDVSLTSCIFLIARGCVLFVWLGDWAEKLR